MTLCSTDPVVPCETLDEAGVASTADVVYPTGSAVGKVTFSLALHVDAAMPIIYKASCGLCGGTTSSI